MAPSSSLTAWSYFTASILALLASALILFPRLLLFLSQSSAAERGTLTSLEAFLTLHFGIYLVVIAAALILNTPSKNPPIPSSNTSVPSHPLLVPVTIAATLLALASWNTSYVNGLTSFAFAINATIGIWGLWTILFANSSSISKSTGADKRTSAFIFGNKAAASSQKELKKRK